MRPIRLTGHLRETKALEVLMIVQDLFDILLYLRYAITTTLRLPMGFRRPRGLLCDMEDMWPPKRKGRPIGLLYDLDDLEDFSTT